jgi:hypothetical protein
MAYFRLRLVFLQVFFSGLFDTVFFLHPDCAKPDGRMTDELGRTVMEVVVAYSHVFAWRD